MRKCRAVVFSLSIFRLNYTVAKIRYKPAFVNVEPGSYVGLIVNAKADPTARTRIVNNATVIRLLTERVGFEIESKVCFIRF